MTPKTLPSRKRRSATLSDHSQTSRIPVPISLSIYFDYQDPPESKASVCDIIRPLADFQDTGANKLKLRFRPPIPSRVESVGLRHYQTTRRLPGWIFNLLSIEGGFLIYFPGRLVLFGCSRWRPPWDRYCAQFRKIHELFYFRFHAISIRFLIDILRTASAILATTSRLPLPVPIRLNLDFDSQYPPESKASVCDTTRPLADSQDTGAN